MLRCALIALVGAGLIAPAAAQAQRAFPADALRGVMLIQQPPDLTINDLPARLSPGARIRADNNMQVLSGAVIGQRLVVHYTLETNGLVHNVWVLTAEEMSKRPWPTTPEQAQRWSFDADAQTWTRR